MRQTILSILFILSENSAFSATPREIRYVLPEPAHVTIAVEDAQGNRVRNLVADAPREAGECAEAWDGYDDAGKPCAAGEYRWRGLAHGDVESRYLGSFYSPGDPPWRTMAGKGTHNSSWSGAGGWLSDHREPLSVYACGGDVFVGSELAEAGCGIVRVDAKTGRKIWGTSFIALGGGSAFAREGETLFIASEGGWTKDKFQIVRFDLGTYRIVPVPDAIAKNRAGRNIHQQRSNAFVQEKQSDFSGIRGMALTPDEIAVSLADKGGRIVFFSRETAEFTREIPLPGAGQLARAPDGSLWAAYEGGVAKIDLDRLDGLDRLDRLELLATPRGLAIDSEGNFYVSDVAPGRFCVEVFAPDGTHLRTIGRPGGRREGRFDPLAMGEPTSICIDSQGLLWVAEHDFRPKRVSVWNPQTGDLVRDYVGTPYYGGGGSFDAANGFAYYDGMRFALAPDLSGATLDAVLYRPEEHSEAELLAGRRNSAAPSTIRAWRGRTMLVSDSGYNGHPFIGEIAGDRLVPRVALGDLVKTNAAGKAATVGVRLWQDGEIFECEGPRAAMMWSSRIGPDMELVLRIPATPGNGWQTDALAILRPDDELHYDFDRMLRLEMPDPLRGMIFSAAVTPDGGTIIVNAGRNGERGANVIAAISADDGRLLWSYPNPYPSNGHNSPMPDAGDLRHTCGIEGWAAIQCTMQNAQCTMNEAVFQLNGNKGTRYLFTADGLFVTELFGDQRLHAPITGVLEAHRGMVLSTNSLGGECFGGWLGNGADGRVLQIAGKSALALCEVAGIDTLRRLEGGALFLDAAPPDVAASPSSPPDHIDLMDCGAFGFQHGWQHGVERTFPEDGAADVAFGTSRSSGSVGPLRLWIRVRDASPWTNGGSDPELLFRTGDCIDLRWAANPDADPKRRAPIPGDIRLVFAPDGTNGIAAVRYVFVDPAVPEEACRTFASPVGVAKVARVECIDAVKTSVAKTKDGYEFTADIPWKVLGESGPPRHGETRRMDAGVVFGDADGATAVRRIYLFDRESGIVDDLPSEVRVNPSNWGIMKF